MNAALNFSPPSSEVFRVTRRSLRAGLIALVVGCVPFGAAQAALEGSFTGLTFGSFADSKIGPGNIVLGRTALQPLSCRGTGGEVSVQDVTDVEYDGGRLFSAAAIRTTVFGDKTATTATARNTARLTDVSLLDGLITADEILAVANVRATEGRIARSAEGSKFANLRIAGKGIDANVGANTEVALPGIGSVTLKKVSRKGNSDGRSIDVEMLAIDVSVANRFGIPVGTTIKIANASAGYVREELPATIRVRAFGVQANSKIGQQLQSQIGTVVPITAGCLGTDGETQVNRVAAVDVGQVLSLSSGESTALATETRRGVVGRATSEVNGLGLFGGLVKAATVKAVAEERLVSGERTSSTEGTGITGLTVNGASLGTVTRPNVRVNIPLVGYVIINERDIPAAGSRQPTISTGLRIVVTQAGNRLGLPVGSEITVGRAQALAVP